MPINNRSRTQTNGDETTEQKSSMSPIEDGATPELRTQRQSVDDRGTTPEEAEEILRTVRDDLFQMSDEKLAVALGRSPQEVKAWMSGTETIDADALLKARTLAREPARWQDDDQVAGGRQENKSTGQGTGQKGGKQISR